MNFVIVLFGVIGYTVAYPEFRKVRVYHNGMFADEDVMLDEAEGYALITVSHINGTGIPTINLHDIQAGFSVLKDVLHKRCYIHDSTHTMQEIKARINALAQNGGKGTISQFFRVESHTPVSVEALSAYGDKIASFCQHYESTFIVQKQVGPTRKERFIEMSTGNMWCIICIIDGQPC